MQLIKSIQLIVLGLTMSFPLCAAENMDITAIQNKLNIAVRAWNMHEIQPMLDLYNKSGDIVYINQSKIIGYKKIAASFLQRFPTAKDNGQLTFSNLDILILSDRYAFVTGQWTLRRVDMPRVTGFFSTLFEKINDDWKIIVDHTNQV